MVARIVVSVGACLAACAATLAQDGPVAVPIVLGDEPAVVRGPEPASDVPIDAAVPAESGSESAGSVLVEDAPYSGMVFGAEPAPTASCTTEPCPWTSFTTFDALFMQRTNPVGPLAVTGPATDAPGIPLISAGDVRYPTIPGMRLFHGRRSADCAGWEIGYLGIWGMYADSLAASPSGGLALPGQLGLVKNSGLDNATAIRPVLNGTLNSFEINAFTTRTFDGCRRHDPLPWRRSCDLLAGTASTADWILGIRWAGLDETAALEVTALTNDPPPAFRTTPYRVTTSSHLVGPQLGHRRRVEWGDWALEGWAKAALTASFLSQAQSAVVGPFDLDVIRGPRSSTTFGVGMIGDLNATVVRRLGDHWGVRAGYTLLWFSGVAPAASQWDFTNTTTSGTRLVADTVFLHGATLGLEATW